MSVGSEAPWWQWDNSTWWLEPWWQSDNCRPSVLPLLALAGTRIATTFATFLQNVKATAANPTVPQSHQGSNFPPISSLISFLNSSLKSDPCVAMRASGNMRQFKKQRFQCQLSHNKYHLGSIGLLQNYQYFFYNFSLFSVFLNF